MVGAVGVREWIELDLGRDYRVTATATQGRFGAGRGQEYAEAFVLEYYRNATGKWSTYRNHSKHEVRVKCTFDLGILMSVSRHVQIGTNRELSD